MDSRASCSNVCIILARGLKLLKYTRNRSLTWAWLVYVRSFLHTVTALLERQLRIYGRGRSYLHLSLRDSAEDERTSVAQMGQERTAQASAPALPASHADRKVIKVMIREALKTSVKDTIKECMTLVVKEGHPECSLEDYSTFVSNCKLKKDWTNHSLSSLSAGDLA